jgi:hypothetical protein
MTVMTQIDRMYGGTLVLATIPVLLLMAAQVWRFPRERRVRGDTAAAVRLAAELVALGNVVGVAVLALVPGNAGGRGVDLVPLHEVYRVWQERGFSSAPVDELYVNVGLLVPFAAAARFAWPRVASLGRTLGLTAAIAVTVEVLQYGLGLGRVTSVTDVILTVTGAALAWLVVDRMSRIAGPADEFGAHPQPIMRDPASRRRDRADSA